MPLAIVASGDGKMDQGLHGDDDVLVHVCVTTGGGGGAMTSQYHGHLHSVGEWKGGGEG